MKKKLAIVLFIDTFWSFYSNRCSKCTNNYKIIIIDLNNKVYINYLISYKIHVIVGLKIMINLNEYIPIQKVRLFNFMTVYFDFDLSNSMYSSFGIDSDSTVYNMFSFFSLLLLVILIHI